MFSFEDQMDPGEVPEELKNLSVVEATTHQLVITCNTRLYAQTWGHSSKWSLCYFSPKCKWNSPDPSKTIIRNQFDKRFGGWKKTKQVQIYVSGDTLRKMH